MDLRNGENEEGAYKKKMKEGKTNKADQLQMSIVGWEAWFWKRYFPQCLKCENECMQSSEIKDLYCPQFKRHTNE